MAKKKNDLTASPFAPLSLGKTTASTQSKPKAIMATAQSTQATRKAGQTGKNALVLPTPSALIQAQAQKSATKTAQPKGGPVKPKPAQGDGVNTGAGGVSLPVLRQMNANSMAWHKADAQKRNALELENAKLRAQAKLSYDDHTGRTLAGNLNLSAPVEVAHGSGATQVKAKQLLSLPVIDPNAPRAVQGQVRAKPQTLWSRVAETLDSANERTMGGLDSAFETGMNSGLESALEKYKAGKELNVLDKYRLGLHFGKNWREYLDDQTRAGTLDTALHTAETIMQDGARRQQLAAQQQEHAMQGMSEHGKAALGLLGQGAQMLGSAAIASTGGGNPMLFTGVSSASQAGQAAEEARQLGADARTQARYGGTMGLLNAAIESAGGIGGSRVVEAGAAKLGQKILPKAVQRAAEKVGASTVGRIIGNATEEGAENVAQYAATVPIKNAMLGTQEQLSAGEAAREFGSGAVFGGIFGAGREVGGGIGNAIDARADARIDPMQYGKTPQQAMQEQRAREAMPPQEQPAEDTAKPMPQASETRTNFDDGTELKDVIATQFEQNKTAPVETEPVQNRGLNKVIAENHEAIKKTGILVEMNGNEFQGGGKKLVDYVTDFFKSLGNKVTRVGFGDVTLNRSGARDSISHGMGRNKAIAFTAVPSVIENGEIIDVQNNWKGRGYDTVTFGGRVKISGVDYDMGVIVKRYDNAENSSKYYVHEVLLTDAENGTVSFKTGTLSGNPSDTAPLSIDSISQNQQNSNPLDIAQQGAETQALGQNTEANTEPILRQGTWQEGEIKPKLRPEHEERPAGAWADYDTEGDQDAVSGLESQRAYLADVDQARIDALEAGEPLAVGDQVRDARVGNIGTVAAVNRDGTADVTFRNAQTHAAKTVSVRAGQLERIAPQAPEVTPDSLHMAQAQREALDSDSYEIPGIIDAEEYAVREAENREAAQGQLDALESKSYRQPDEEAAQRADHLRVGDTETAPLQRAWQDVKRAEAHRDNVRNELKLTDTDEKYLQSALITGSTSNFYEADNPQDLLYAYEAEQAVRDARRPINEANAQRREAMDLEAAEHADAIATHAKDKVNGLAYERETMERNIFDIFGKEHRAEAETLNKTYFESVHKAVAQGNKLKSGYRQRVTALNLDKHESALVQMMLEGEHGAAADYIKNNGIEITPERNVKLERARDTMREIYKELYDQINDALLRNGQEPVPYRRNYAPHFTIDKPDTAMGRLRYMLGLGKSADTLPTDIAGITENFRPGKKWFGNLLQRKGELTDFDAVYGFDQYIETAADVITLTDSVQRLRALEDAVRYRLSDEGTQAKIDAIQNNRELDALERLKEKEKVYDDNLSTIDQLKHEFINQKRMGMRGLVTELRRYTDSLAGKKSKDDRDIEDKLGRGIYELSRKVEGRVAANMIAANPGSWLTNFIPLTQASGEISTMNLLRGMRDTVTSYAKDDGFVDASAFLTNRRGSERMTGTTLQKVGDTLGKPMEFIDRFTADTIVRARAVQNMQRGLSFDDAMNEADAFAAGLMADRSKGAMPTLFNAKNPVTKAFTMFQLEVNNQLSYMGKDLTRRLGEDGAKAIAFALTKLFAGAFLYNKLYRELTGRDAAFDPVGAVAKAFGIGEDDGKERSASDVLLSLGKSAAEQLPFVSGLIGGGRIPVSAALPNVGKLYTAATDGEKAPEKRLQMAAKELAKPATYLLPPFGGGAVKKAVEGFRTVRDGGAYELDNDGNKQLLFPAYGQKPQDYLKAMAFGRYSSKEATNYVEDGFKRLSADNTKAYDALTAEGVDRKTAFEAIKTLSTIKGDNDTAAGEKKRQYIMSLDSLSAEQKRTLDKMTVSGDKPNNAAWYESPEEFKITSHMSGEDQVEARIRARLAVQAGVSADDYLRYEDLYKAKNKPFGVTDAKAREKVLDALEQDGSLDDEGKAKIAEYLLLPKMSDSRREDWEHYKGKISPQTFVKIADKYSEIQAKYDGYQKPEEDGYSGAQLQATEFAKWVDTLPVAADTKTAIKDDFASYSFVPAKPIAYDWDMLSSEDEKAHVAAMQKTGLSIATYNAIKKHASSFEADKDSDGKSISGSKKKKVIAYVQSNIALTEEQKRLVIEAMGYKTTSKEKSSKKSSVNGMTKGFPALPVFK